VRLSFLPFFLVESADIKLVTALELLGAGEAGYARAIESDVRRSGDDDRSRGSAAHGELGWALEGHGWAWNGLVGPPWRPAMMHGPCLLCVARVVYWTPL
jgi:hypothetical protein